MNFIFQRFIWKELQVDVFSIIIFLIIILMSGLSSIELENQIYLIWGLTAFALGAFEFSLSNFFSKLYFNSLIQRYLKEVGEKKLIK
jgi:hypothetical protein